MAGFGPPPKDPTKRQRRNAPEPFLELPLHPEIDAPDPPNADAYLEETRQWYAVWASSPQASQFLATDWQRLHMLAPIVDQFYRKPTLALLTEITRSESKLGATRLDRARLRWVVGPGGEA